MKRSLISRAVKASRFLSASFFNLRVCFLTPSCESKEADEPLAELCKVASVNFTIVPKLPRTKRASKNAFQGGQNFLEGMHAMFQYFVGFRMN